MQQFQALQQQQLQQHLQHQVKKSDSIIMIFIFTFFFIH